jgi:hypothetical protein
MDGDILLVDGEPLYTAAAGMREFRSNPSMDPLHTPATSATAAFAEDGHSVTYRGRFITERTICLGDIQNSAAAILKVILALRG